MSRPPPNILRPPCNVCSRQGQGFEYRDPVFRGDSPVHFCSFACSEVFMVSRARDVPLTHDEARALKAGGDQAGAYLDRLGKTDLATLTPEEWHEFCRLLYVGTCDDLALQAQESVPF
ncbi:MAG: DUF6511 domain-containing protein [Pseudomonadota bacterium]